VIALLQACVGDNAQPQDAAAPAPPTCAKVITGPTPIGGGNPSCSMAVMITVDCPVGQSGRVVAVFGEAGGPTLFAASLDGGYQCGMPITVTRDGFSCSDLVAADVQWYTPTDAGPASCP